MPRQTVDKIRAANYYEDNLRYEAEAKDFLLSTVFEQDEGPSRIDTGLLDKDGNPITRSRERKQIGFITF